MRDAGRRSIDVTIMRGGTSRGPVLLADDFPTDPMERDLAAIRLVGDGPSLVDGVGGGGPVTAKIVLISKAEGNDADFDYQVGNIVVGKGAVDWSGTCGNMTAAVPVFALDHGLVEDNHRGQLRLRNLSTSGIIEATIQKPEDYVVGSETGVRTAYVDPVGSVFGQLLPTGVPQETLTVAGQRYSASLLDITHPYLFLAHDEVVGTGDVRDPEVVARVEAIRGAACVRLNLVADADDAMEASPAVPRVVLLHRNAASGTARITAVSMGQVIASVPVTAAMCLVGARSVAGSLPAEIVGGLTETGDTEVRSSGAILHAALELHPNGTIRTVSVDRSVRSILRGTAWI